MVLLTRRLANDEAEAGLKGLGIRAVIGRCRRWLSGAECGRHPPSPDPNVIYIWLEHNDSMHMCVVID